MEGMLQSAYVREEVMEAINATLVAESLKDSAAGSWGVDPLSSCRELLSPVSSKQITARYPRRVGKEPCIPDHTAYPVLQITPLA